MLNLRKAIATVLLAVAALLSLGNFTVAQTATQQGSVSKPFFSWFTARFSGLVSMNP
jgi:hypothetical protein